MSQYDSTIVQYEYYVVPVVDLPPDLNGWLDSMGGVGYRLVATDFQGNMILMRVRQ